MGRPIREAPLPRLRGGSHTHTPTDEADRVEWTAGAALSAYGLRVGLRASEPLGIRERGKLRPVEVEVLGGKQCKRALPVGLVVVSPYDEGRRAWRPRALPPGRAVLELLRYAAPARRDPERTLATLEQVVAGA